MCFSLFVLFSLSLSLSLCSSQIVPLLLLLLLLFFQRKTFFVKSERKKERGTKYCLDVSYDIYETEHF